MKKRTQFTAPHAFVNFGSLAELSYTLRGCTQFYANALRDALRKANNRRQEVLTQMTQDDWRVAVTREMEADLWYEQPNEEEIQFSSLIEAPQSVRA